MIPDLRNRDFKKIVESRSPTVNDLQGFVMAHLNIASLPKHIDELRLQLTKKPLDILSINETRLDDTINDGLIHLNGTMHYVRTEVERAVE